MLISLPLNLPIQSYKQIDPQQADSRVIESDTSLIAVQSTSAWY